MLHGRFVQVGKALTGLQILGCELLLHQNAFGGRAPPGPAGGATSLFAPQTQTPSRY